jgi:hypothetical protein
VFSILLRVVITKTRSLGEMDDVRRPEYLFRTQRLNVLLGAISLSLILFLDTFPIGVKDSAELSSLAGVPVFKL